MTVPRPGTSLVTSLGATLVMAGCAMGGEPEPTPLPSPTETSSPPSVEDPALESYTGLWAAIVEQSRTGELDESVLERYATGQALEFARESLHERVEAGEVASGEPSFSPEVTEVDQQSETVEIRDCMDSTQWLREDAETGELVEEEPEEPVQRRIEATAEFDGLAWRVSELLLGQVGSC